MGSLIRLLLALLIVFLVGAYFLGYLPNTTAVLSAPPKLEVGTLPSRLPATDLRRIRFDQLHQLSTRLMMFDMVGALVLLYWEARER